MPCYWQYYISKFLLVFRSQPVPIFHEYIQFTLFQLSFCNGFFFSVWRILCAWNDLISVATIFHRNEENFKQNSLAFGTTTCLSIEIRKLRTERRIKNKEKFNIREHFQIIKRKLEQNFKLNMEICAEFSHVAMFVANSCLRTSLLPVEFCCVCLPFSRLSRKFSRCVLFLLLLLFAASAELFASEWVSKKFFTSKLCDGTFAWQFYRILFHLGFVCVCEIVSPPYLFFHLSLSLARFLFAYICICMPWLSFSLFSHLSYGTFRITTVTKSR